MSGTDVAIEALGEVLAAYRKRIAELEQIVATQQGIIEAAKAEPPSPAQVEES